MLELAGTPHDAAYLSNGDNWISLDEACELLEAGVKQTGDPQFARTRRRSHCPPERGHPGGDACCARWARSRP